MTAYEQVKENWSLYRSGKITLPELLARNNQLIFKREIEELVPPAILKAQRMFSPKSERGAPVDKEERCPF